MPRRNAPLIVGVFAVIGVALTVALLLALGSGRVFRDRTRAVAYFDESVQGLSVGANVKYQGMPVGEVVDMRIDWSGLEREDGAVRIEVVFDLNDRSAPGGSWPVQALVDRGLRAQLALESLLTNVRYVALDLHPDAELAAPGGGAAGYPEVPTIQTDVAQLQEQTRTLLAELAEVDYQALAQSVSRLADQVRRFVEDPVDLGEIVDPRGTLSRQLQGVLDEIERAARSVRRLADQLSRDPGSLIRGGSQ
jgi:paraquat-inducible protein B